MEYLQPIAVAAIIGYMVLPRLYDAIKAAWPKRSSAPVVEPKGDANSEAEAIELLKSRIGSPGVFALGLEIVEANRNDPRAVDLGIQLIKERLTAETQNAVSSETAQAIWGRKETTT